jgi:putative resolvase
MKISIGKAARELGVAQETLRRWEVAGKITVERTPQGHRRYDLNQLRRLVPTKNLSGKPTLVYARLYGSRSRKNKKFIETLQQAAKEI